MVLEFEGHANFAEAHTPQRQLAPWAQAEKIVQEHKEDFSASNLAAPSAQHADPNTQNGMAVAAMNSELDRWTQADAPDLFEKGLEK